MFRCLANWFCETQLLFHKRFQTRGVYHFLVFCDQIFEFINHRRFYTWNSWGTKPYYLKLLTLVIRVFSHQHEITDIQIDFTDILFWLCLLTSVSRFSVWYVVASQCRLSSSEIIFFTSTNFAAWILPLVAGLAGDGSSMVWGGLSDESPVKTLIGTRLPSVGRGERFKIIWTKGVTAGQSTVSIRNSDKRARDALEISRQTTYAEPFDRGQ